MIVGRHNSQGGQCQSSSSYAYHTSIHNINPSYIMILFHHNKFIRSTLAYHNIWITNNNQSTTINSVPTREVSESTRHWTEIN